MKIGNVYYVTSYYNENKFKSLLEKQLTKSAKVFPNTEFIEQALAAYLECKASIPDSKAIKQMENFLKSIEYVDKRDYLGSSTVGEPLEAIEAFNQIIMMYHLSTQQ